MVNMLLYNQFLLAAKELSSYKTYSFERTESILAKYGLFMNNLTYDDLDEINRLIKEYRND